MRIKNGLLPLSLFFVVTAASGAHGAQLIGRVGAVPMEPAPTFLGHSRTRVAMPSAELRTRRTDLAVFLKVRDSLPLPESTARWSVEIIGAQLVPEVVSCAVDELVEFTNRERRPVTISVGGTILARLEPGASAPFTCRDGGRVAMKVNEMPFIEGSVYVGESVGIAGRPDANGRFSLPAPKGTYELRVLGPRSVLVTREVTIGATDLDLGSIDVEASAPPPTPSVAPVPTPTPSPAPVAPPSAAHDKVKTTPTPVPVPKPAKLKLEKPESAGAAPTLKELGAGAKAKPGAEAKTKAPAEAKPPKEPKPEAPVGEEEPKTGEPRGAEEPPAAKLPTPTKPKAEKKKAEDDFFELEP
jgi:hypothetical protein